MTIDVASILKTLRSERSHAVKEVAKLDKAIASLSQLSRVNSAPSSNGHSNGRVRTMSVAARRKIAAAQKARWAKFRKEQKATK